AGIRVLRHHGLLDAFLTYVGLARTQETVDFYRGKLTVLVRYYDALPPEEWTKVGFETFIAKGKAGTLEGQITKWGNRSVQMMRGGATLCVIYLRGQPVPTPEFWTGVKRPRLHIKESKFFTLDQAKSLLEVAEATNSPLYFRVALAIGAGMRRAEQSRARWE